MNPADLRDDYCPLILPRSPCVPRSPLSGRGDGETRWPGSGGKLPEAVATAVTVGAGAIQTLETTPGGCPARGSSPHRSSRPFDV